ncbi:hypothetical protein FB567DRAFT_539855 [Paraphoma chrysanthemicola]|uniref:Glycosyltransferase family 31 protein n=1 Tax=Paraphoma chrysanthemicola TaxID=798071 RepID=A0A8K0QUM2_9PLEO|nr:hypothetical protein FB567DRAFT_539855 [Paraphoma chrysanthemicola]
MPMLTPSRVAIVVLCLSLVSFLLLGYPSQFAQPSPSQPIIDHYDHKNVHSEPIIPAPFIPTPTKHATPGTPTPHGDRPEEEEDHRWDDATKASGQTPPPGPTETGVAEFEGDGGRWEDEQKQKDGGIAGDKQEADASAPPTTLLTHVVPAPSAVNATNATMLASTPTETVLSTHKSSFCHEVRGAPNVMVILRTSKVEITEQLPAQIKSLLSCVPNFAIFSDHKGEIDGIPVYNALENISGETKRVHDEFNEYQLMHADPVYKPDAGKTKNLDKWKFLPMVYKAHKLKPDAKFYYFIEADTSLSWTNVLQWVNRLDYRIPYYSGSPTFINSIQLAQRGSGIMLSQGAMRRYAKSYDELYASKWEVELGKGCCGDLALSQALGDAHVEFYSSWPLMQGEQPASLDYTKKHWCAPAVSWHHISADVLQDIFLDQKNWTAKHGWDKPYLFRDAFESFVQPHLAAKKEKWDNLSQDTKIVAPQGRQQQLKDEEERSRKHKEEEDQKKESERINNVAMSAKPFADPPTVSHNQRRDDKPAEIDWDKLAETFKDAADSSDKCQKSCELIEDCLQWRYKALGDGECHLGKIMRLGKKTSEQDEPWSSGWMLDRIEATKKDWECKEVNWRFYQ